MWWRSPNFELKVDIFCINDSYCLLMYINICSVYAHIYIHLVLVYCADHVYTIPYCMLYLTVYYTLLYTIPYCILYLTVYYTLLHTIPYCILYLTVYYTLLYTIPNCILYLIVYYTLLYTIPYCILCLTAYYTLLCSALHKNPPKELYTRRWKFTGLPRMVRVYVYDVLLYVYCVYNCITVYMRIRL